MRSEIYDLRRDLCRTGWPTMRQWAEAFGHKSDTVRHVISRHWNIETKPRGKIAVQVLADLRQTLHLGIRPEEMKYFGFQKGGRIVEEIHSV